MSLPKAGDAYLLKTAGEFKHHLWVLLALSADHKRVIMVNLTTQRSYSDATIVLKAGDHPFVKHETAVNYSDAIEVGVDRLATAVRTGEAIQQPVLTPEILKKIQSGLIHSPRTQPVIKQKFQEWTS
jgi:hypothetical protein